LAGLSLGEHNVTVYAWGETGNVYTSETVVFLIGDMLQPPPSPTTSPSPTSSPTPSPKPEPKQPTPTTPPAPLPAPQEPAPPSEPVQIEPFPTTLVATSVITTTAAVCVGILIYFKRRNCQLAIQTLHCTSGTSPETCLYSPLVHFYKSRIR